MSESPPDLDLSATDRLRGAAAAALIAASRALPRESAMRLAAATGRSIARFSGPRTAVALQNLRIAFPQLRESQRRAVLEASYANVGRALIEFANMGKWDARQLRDLADVEGWENLAKAREAAPTGGVICLTAHYGSWELLVAIMAAHEIDISVIHRSRDNPLVDRVMARLREEMGVELLPLGSAARGALRALRAGRVVAVTFDQNARRSEGVFVPFFGRLACTRDAPARLAMRTGASVLPVFAERLAGSERHRVRILPHLELAAEEGDREAAVLENVTRMAGAIESAIRRAPEQWTWTHRRWRTQPLGEPRAYPSRRIRTQLEGTPGR
ncbi:MAG: lysophospholipid acyltransferase family protein [Myxococcales bacterium]|nr:lysophospholipid acyltransferase family protein [Myxococcales bacterium]